MDNQLPSPNTPAPAEGQPVGNPENLHVQAAPAAEVAPPAQPGATPAPVSVAAAKLTPTEVAAALAATPGPGAPAVASPAPLTAGDVDVIEPEWVDKAEAVVREHHGDPYAEEEAIEELQEDYLQKRYGINVAEPDADDTKPKGT